MWHVAENGQSKGPYEQRELEQMIAQGSVNADTLVWRNGFEQWQKAKDTELAGLFEPGGEQPNQQAQEGPAQEKQTQDEYRQDKQNEQNEQDEQDDQELWYVMRQGQRLGPLNREQALEAIDSPETMVWHHGQWQKAGESPLAPFLSMRGPVYGPVSNNVVWLAALSPLLSTMLTAALLYNNISPEDAAMLQQGMVPEHYFWVVFAPFVLQTILGTLDLIKLKSAGYKIVGLAVSMVLFFPVYLFLRARKLQHNYSYFIVYLVCILFLLLS